MFASKSESDIDIKKSWRCTVNLQKLYMGNTGDLLRDDSIMNSIVNTGDTWGGGGGGG